MYRPTVAPQGHTHTLHASNHVHYRVHTMHIHYIHMGLVTHWTNGYCQTN